MLSLMRSPARSAVIFRKVNLLLMKGADRLTGEDLVRIAQVAEAAGAVIYIRIPSWQVLLGVPGERQGEVLETLRKRGYDSVKVARKLERGSALRLKGKASEGALEDRQVRMGLGRIVSRRPRLSDDRENPLFTGGPLIGRRGGRGSGTGTASRKESHPG